MLFRGFVLFCLCVGLPLTVISCSSGAASYPLAVGSPVPTATNTPIITPQSPTNTFTFSSTYTFSPTPTFTSTPIFTITPSYTPTQTSTNTVTNSPTITPTKTITNTPTSTNTATCTPTVTLSPTSAYQWASQTGNLTPGSSTGVFNEPSGVAVNSGGTTLYVADNASNGRIQYFSISGHTLTYQGSWTVPAPAQGYSSGLATDSSGNVYFADSTNNMIRVYGPTGSPVTQYGSSNGYSFNQPTGVAVDSSGNIYVADTNNSQVQELAYTVIQTPGATPTIEYTTQTINTSPSLNLPQGVAVSGTTLYISDTLNNRIVTYNTTTQVFGTPFGTTGAGNSQFNSPIELSTNSAGTTLFVADSGNNRIMAFTSSGSYLTQWGEASGAGHGILKNPQGVAADSTNVYVVDSGDNLVQIFDYQ